MSKHQMSSDETFAEKNAKHFDKVAPGEWPQWVLDLHKQTTDFLASPEFPGWLGISPAEGHRRMLDYACGNGLISGSLRPLFSSVTGMDVSKSMLDKYQATADRLGLGPEEMRGVRGDLLGDDLKPTEPPLEESALWNFDLVAISMALHHVEDPESAIKKLAARLKVGGKLLVIDWTPVDGSTPAQREYQKELERDGNRERIDGALMTHAASHTISKPYGFTEQEMRDMFEEAGCRDMSWKIAEELTPIPVIEEMKSQLYFAAATKG
ncbi:methyltransferase type 11 [Colletotrichum musicola]|uniref:Methyltransferase type 11 n=1 Tax=Colletotrichum musicola TaxID=2175873 RepID=A0A8H6U5Y1_9PEZI|nr:methyltransferase type 11 [Colletotrichum musicola]